MSTKTTVFFTAVQVVSKMPSFEPAGDSFDTSDGSLDSYNDYDVPLSTPVIINKPPSLRPNTQKATVLDGAAKTLRPAVGNRPRSPARSSHDMWPPAPAPITTKEKEENGTTSLRPEEEPLPPPQMAPLSRKGASEDPYGRTRGLGSMDDSERRRDTSGKGLDTYDIERSRKYSRGGTVGSAGGKPDTGDRNTSMRELDAEEGKLDNRGEVSKVGHAPARNPSKFSGRKSRHEAGGGPSQGSGECSDQEASGGPTRRTGNWQPPIDPVRRDEIKNKLGRNASRNIWFFKDFAIYIYLTQFGNILVEYFCDSRQATFSYLTSHLRFVRIFCVS
jgi:hypothetical protein